MNKKIIAVLVLVLLIGGFIGLTGSNRAIDSQDPITLGAILILSDVGAVYGKNSQKGMVGLMPKSGFKSITVNEIVYNKFFQIYFDQKEKLAMQGINSFAGYITARLEELMKKDETFSKFMPKIEKISVDDKRIILNDIVKNRIIEIQFDKNELQCMYCNEIDCKHVGFCESMPEVIEIQGMNTI